MKHETLIEADSPRKADSPHKLLAEALKELVRPSAIFWPRLVRYEKEGFWVALYGNANGIVEGKGFSPALAMEDFDRAWEEKLKGERT